MSMACAHVTTWCIRVDRCTADQVKGAIVGESTRAFSTCVVTGRIVLAVPSQ